MLLVLRGWARRASGDTAEGLAWIEDGIKELAGHRRDSGLPFLLALKAEALHLENRNSEALEAIE
jgi:hypothetical protein